jgi:septal ring factor EnvC (AmiA/AmiB activator)
MKKRFVLFLFFCIFLPHIFSQDVNPQEYQLTKTSYIISEKLMNFKQQSDSMSRELQLLTSRLETTSTLLSISENERKQLEIQSTNLSNSLQSINAELNNCYETITRYETKLRGLIKVLTILLSVIVIRLLGMVAGYILYAKGIKLPRWLDILL